MAERINIADKETLDLALNKLTAAVSNLQDVLSRIGTSEDLSVSTLFGLTKVLAASAGASVVKKVLLGSFTMSPTYSDTSTYFKNIPHEAVDINKSIVLFTPDADSQAGSGCRIQGRTSTSISFYAVGSVAVTWQIIEFN